MKLTISLAQIEVVPGQPEVNLGKGREWIAEARRRGSDLIVFPELWTTFFDLEKASRYAAPLDQGPFVQLAEMAREYSIYVTGSLLSKENGRYLNTAPLFSPTGERLGRYSKIHLFSMMEEDRYLTAGQTTPLFDLPWGRSAIAICYDVRFPELFRKYALAGAKIVFLPAGWPHPRLRHWQTLLRARAIENQMFIAACNHVGRDQGLKFFGHSAIYDPWGETVVEAGEVEMLLTAQIDFDLVEEVRQRMKVFADRRPDFY